MSVLIGSEYGLWTLGLSFITNPDTNILIFDPKYYITNGTAIQEYTFSKETWVYDEFKKIKITYDNGRFEFYINDIKIAPDGPYIEMIIPPNTERLISSCDSSTHSNLIDDVKIYDGAE